MHTPVLQKEVIEYLEPKSNENFIDCTIDGGGHSLLILKNSRPNGKVLGIELDTEMINQLRDRAKEFKKRLILVNNNFVNLREIVKKEKFHSIAGILVDLGMSSWHLEESGRGFSFLKKEPLDMRYDSNNPLTAEKIINYWSEFDIERILREFGEEKFSKEIAREIVGVRKIRPIKTTGQLIETLKEIIPRRYQNQKINFATRTFLALRITVNGELENLKKFLPQAIETLKPGGKLAIISFQSLEDRIVKNFFKEKEINREIKILTKKPIQPNEKEIKINPRSRSAKLRVITKN